MKHLFSARSYIRAIGFSVLAGFALLAFFNSDEVSASFHKAAGLQKEVAAVRSESATPAILRIPEAIAGMAGKVWSWIN